MNIGVVALTHISFDYSKSAQFIGSYKLSFLDQTVESIHHEMHSGSSSHQEYFGLINMPITYNSEEYTLQNPEI